MANESGYSIDRLLRYPYIADRISRVAATTGEISRFYGFAPRATGRSGQIMSGTDRAEQREVVFDIFNNTRLTSTMRAPDTGPTRIKPQKIGQVVATAMRFFESRVFNLNEIDKYRVLGSRRTDLYDAMGAEYITLQLDDLIRRGINSREFVFVNALKGGFKIRHVTDELWYPVPNSYTAGVLTSVNYQVPASHKDQLALGESAADLIGTSWDNPASDIVGNVRALRAVTPRRSGFNLTEAWVNSTVMSEIMANTAAQDIGGSAFRTFDEFREKSTSSTGGVGPNANQSTISFKLRALPEMTWHVYDGGLILPADSATLSQVEDVIDDTSNEVWVPYLNNDEVIFTPPAETARQWMRMYAVKEIIQRQYDTRPEAVYGMAAWVTREKDPVPAYDLRVLDNFLPALTIPNAVYNPSVVFGG